MSIQAMKQMVEALERYDLDYEERLPIIRAGYKAIEEAEKQEPVAWLSRRYVDNFPASGYETTQSTDYGAFPVYTHPPKREWVGLREIQLLGIYEEEQQGRWGDHVRGLQAIEAKLKEKNT